MLRKLRGQMPGGGRADEYRAHDFGHRRFTARDLDEELRRAVHLTRKALVPDPCVRPIQQVELVVARRLQVLEPFAYHYAAACAGEHATAIMCDINALPQQPGQKNFAFAQTQFEAFHTESDRDPAPQFTCTAALSAYGTTKRPQRGRPDYRVARIESDSVRASVCICFAKAVHRAPSS